MWLHLTTSVRSNYIQNDDNDDNDNDNNHSGLQLQSPLHNVLPMPPFKHAIPLLPEPQHPVIARLVRIDALLAQRHLVLLMVVDVTGRAHQAYEDGHRILGQFFARKLRQPPKVKSTQGLGGDLHRGASRASFVVGDLRAVDVGFEDAGVLA